MAQVLEIERGPEATLSAELRGREIREMLATMGAEKAQQTFLAAVSLDPGEGRFNEELFLAIKSAPSVYEFGIPGSSSKTRPRGGLR